MPIYTNVLVQEEQIKSQVSNQGPTEKTCSISVSERPKPFSHHESPGPWVKSAALNCSSTDTPQMRTSHLTNFTVCRPSPFLIVL